MYLEPHSRLLIADTTEVLDAFLDNGLHKEYEIYCQFPHSCQLQNRLKKISPLSVEFNDGVIISEQ
ncbi:hypothetical protein C9I99_03030 [Photobacterium lutimaris]|uniref:Uncharacterized protein n=1 Tax=Photobacterium lutimaris TaxID=388278 RepID=A0A2T3J3X7_9GAMM|nr:hypothetical protein C9I99_03030 [Photobacterium lutimaris]TDR79093.1 hypothetical protein DFP78_101608 [Photobacterium lutimaris]